jgi:hypothetical protein
MLEAIRSIVSDPIVLGVWTAAVVISIGWLLRDLRINNPGIAGLMKWVWILTILYSGPLGLAFYYYSGRAQIRRDSVYRRGFRSTAHCYSGCGAGEIIGVTVAVGVLALGNLGLSLLTFTLAYLFGYALTVGPLLQEGVALPTALRDAFITETPSIVVMEVVAIGVDLWLAGGATIGQALFWGSLVFSLSMGLLAAYPVNIGLVALGVKEGMMDPREHGRTGSEH